MGGLVGLLVLCIVVGGAVSHAQENEGSCEPLQETEFIQVGANEAPGNMVCVCKGNPLPDDCKKDKDKDDECPDPCEPPPNYDLICNCHPVPVCPVQKCDPCPVCRPKVLPMDPVPPVCGDFPCAETEACCPPCVSVKPLEEETGEGVLDAAS